MTATTYRHQELVITGEIDRVDDVRHPSAADDHRGTSVDHPVMDFSRLVVALVGRQEKLAAQAGLELLDRCFAERGSCSHAGCNLQVYHRCLLPLDYLTVGRLLR